MARKNHAGSEGFEDVSSYSSSKEYKKRKKNRAPPALFQTARHGARTADCNFAPSRDSGGESLICKRM